MKKIYVETDNEALWEKNKTFRISTVKGKGVECSKSCKGYYSITGIGNFCSAFSDNIIGKRLEDCLLSEIKGV